MCISWGGGVDKNPESNLKSLWKRAVTPLRSRLGADDYATWIEPMRPIADADGIIEVVVPNRLFASWVEDNFLDELASSWVETAGRQTRFRFTWGDDQVQGELFRGASAAAAGAASDEAAAGPAAAASGQTRTKTRSGGLISRYDFTSYVVGQSNQFARAAAIAVAGQPGTLYNPFFLFGGVGLGKTHLVNAIGNAIVDENESARVLFISADTFTNQLIDAISRNKSQEFKNRMRRIEVLILDDVQFLAGRERTQQEFFHIFNALYESGRQIILTSDKFPHEIHGLEERLCNRFGWGLVADIQPPDGETRVAILERKARDEGINVPMPVLSFVASRFESNIRDLEGALTRLSAWASLNRCEITLELAERLLGDSARGAAKGLTLEEVDTRVTSHFGLKPGELQARRRTRKVAEARQVAMYIMRHHAGASFPAIGEFLGGRDHSTVVHGCQAVQKRCAEEPRFRSMVEALLRILGCG